ncbi:MAG: imidazoleglycerol-phosphate dehydratase HisB [Candidatus Dormibacteria bacterium]
MTVAKRKVTAAPRAARRSRRTRETAVTVRLTLDGKGVSRIATGLPFLDHMLEQVARFGGLDLDITAEGDLQVDEHHTVEDCGITLGAALSEALGERRGLARFGHAYAPLDEALCRVVVDFSGRPFCEVNLGRLTGRIGTFPAELLPEFFRAFSQHAGMTLHVDLVRGRNRHHIAESAFKALGLALRQAVTASGNEVPSTKGVL